MNPTGAPERDYCNELTTGRFVQPTVSQDPAPVPEGGSIQEGIYRLTAFNLHDVRNPPSEGFPPRAITLEVRGARIQLVSQRQNDLVATGTYQYRVAQTSISLDRRCGEWTPSITGFTATPTELKLFVELPTGVGVWVLTRQIPSSS